MSSTKLRRKSFIAALGAMGLGLTALGGTAAARPKPDAAGKLNASGHVRKAPKSVPYAGRAL